jgi:hypothetical protein
VYLLNREKIKKENKALIGKKKNKIKNLQQEVWIKKTAEKHEF